VNLAEVRRKEGIYAAEHVGSWHFIYGGFVFSAMHMFRYENGWEDVDRSRLAIREDQQLLREHNQSLDLTQAQSNEYLKNFAYWPQPRAREGPSIYDIRTYQLKAGR